MEHKWREEGEKDLKIQNMAVPRLRRLVAGLSLWMPGFDPGSVHVGFVVDKVALVFPRVLRFFPEYFDFFPKYFGFSFSISFHRRSITWKNEKINCLSSSSSSHGWTVSLKAAVRP
jgi:hypothetical protein